MARELTLEPSPGLDGKEQSPLSGGCDQPWQPADPAALNSTADLHLVGCVVVTENDGDPQSFRRCPHHQGGAGQSTPPAMPRPAMAWRISSPSSTGSLT